MNPTLSLYTIAGIKSTPYTDGEFVKARKFVAETDTAEIYTQNDCLVVYRDDLSIKDTVIDLVDITVDDRVIDAFYVESSKGAVFVQVVAPALNTQYRYYRAVKPIQAEAIFDAIVEKATASKLDRQSETALTNFEAKYFGNGSRGSFRTFFLENLACHNLLQVRSTILSFIKKATNVV